MLTGEKINYAETFEYNEYYHDTAQELAAGYSRLSYQYPNESKAKEWSNKAIEWRKYDRIILRDLVLDTREEAEKLMAELTAKCKEMEELEVSLQKKFSVKISF